MRRIRELAEQPCHHERHLLADVDGDVAHALQRSGHQHHVHGPLAYLDVVADVECEVEDLAVEDVDDVVLAAEVLGQGRVATAEGLLGLDDLDARLLAHLADLAEHLLVPRRLVALEGEELADVHALVAHALDMAYYVQDRGYEA